MKGIYVVSFSVLEINQVNVKSSMKECSAQVLTSKNQVMTKPRIKLSQC